MVFMKYSAIHAPRSTMYRRDEALTNDSRSICRWFELGNGKNRVAKHLSNNPGHVITSEDLPLVKKVDRPQHHDAWGSIIILKNDRKHLLNKDYGNIESSLIDIFSE
jgi:hypothetical protein